jgi:hypothetical protein
MRMRKTTFIILLGVIFISSCGTKHESNKKSESLKSQKELLKQAQEEEFTE